MESGKTGQGRGDFKWGSADGGKGGSLLVPPSWQACKVVFQSKNGCPSCLSCVKSRLAMGKCI